MAQQYCTRSGFCYKWLIKDSVQNSTTLAWRERPQTHQDQPRPPVYSVTPHRTSTIPRWTYKNANWERFSNLVDQLTQKINNKRQNLNIKIKAFNRAALKAAQESTTRGARKNYKPYSTEELQQQEDTVIEARNLVEENRSEENNISLKAASAKHRRTFMQETRKTWHAAPA